MRKKLTLRNVKIGWKYGFTIILVFILIAASTAYVSKLLTDIGDNVRNVDMRGNQAVDITEMGAITREKGVPISTYMYNQSMLSVEEYETYTKQFNELEEKIRERITTAEERELFEQIVSKDQEMNELFMNEVVPTANKGDTSNAASLVSEAKILLSSIVFQLDELREVMNEERFESTRETKDLQELTLIIQLATMIGSIVIGGVLIFLISRSVSRNLGRVVSISNQIADGNLAVEPMNYKGKDEIGKLSTAINGMTEHLRNVIHQVATVSQTVTSHSEELTQSANEVKAGSEQVAETMQELASGTETQANSASDLAEVISSFTNKVHQANDKGALVQQASNEVMVMTNEGSTLMENSTTQMVAIDRIVKESVQKMKGLDAQSKEISKLVSVIRDIAEQTNLLALNAAIEAARAGEQGKGFAVVADEVRKLAEQVSVSVTDITGIVTGIQTESNSVAQTLETGYAEVEKGTTQLRTTGETFQGIQLFVNEMTNSVKQISENLSEMATSSEEMNRSIEDIAAISEESAAGVEQTSASSQQTSSSMEEVAGSSEQLAKLAAELNVLVGKFRL
ncbi:methyl-accepting chemotaxis protein [Oceanobacillus picturae]|uniref:methyl-accepting chemotaxis protein n=1 Tax=Oceanobacillus picturae TaxID=171693 RepID=UPI000E68BC56|nr:methyl-accepting chemotaxis protein [Oceanobacillus picturae]RIU94461.1 methyl-accepting chemotaxis protein [Oceanobacillus picturae]